MFKLYARQVSRIVTYELNTITIGKKAAAAKSIFYYILMMTSCYVHQ